MAHEFKHSRRVEFAETDMAGIVHFSNFFRYMESAEHAFFRSLGLSLHGQPDGHMHGWARVRATCEYAAPAHYMDLVEVHLRVCGKTARSLAYSFVFRVLDDEEVPEGREIARGELEVVHVSRGPGDERMRAAEMPADVARLVEVAPES